MCLVGMLTLLPLCYVMIGQHVYAMCGGMGSNLRLLIKVSCAVQANSSHTIQIIQGMLCNRLCYLHICSVLLYTYIQIVLHTIYMCVCIYIHNHSPWSAHLDISKTKVSSATGCAAVTAGGQDTLTSPTPRQALQPAVHFHVPHLDVTKAKASFATSCAACSPPWHHQG